MVIKSKVFNLLIALFLGVFVKSQTIQSVTAKVVDVNNKPALGNAIILSKDSSFIKGTSIVNGKFLLSNINQKKFILKLSSLSFMDTFIHVNYDNTEFVDLGTITVKEKIVVENNVTVTSKANPITQKADGTTEIKVANTLLSSSSTINEILSQSPGVQVDGNAISVFGKGQAILYLNNQRITEEQFAAIPVAQIDKIEIITSPSSKYDAEGRAVVNIKTKKNVAQGYSGSVRQNTAYSKFANGFNSFTSTNVDVKENKLSLQANYAIQLGKDREVLHTIRTRSNPAEFLNSDLTTSWNRNWDNYSNYELGAQYDFNKYKYISVKYNGFSNHLGGNQVSDNSINSIYGNGKYNSIIKTNNHTGNNALSINYNAIIDSLGSSIFIAAQYTNFKNLVNDFIDEKRFETINSQSFLNNKIDNNINIATAQIDYNKELGNNKTIEAGARVSYINNGSILNFFSSPNALLYNKVDSLSNMFNYKEFIPAAYINFKGKINNKTNYSIGLRAELTQYSLAVQTTKSFNTDRTYFNLFPNASLTYKVDNNLSYNVSISSRITRVNYRNLNPNLVYQDPFTSVQGNPYLLPEKSYSIEFNAKYKTFSLKLGYDYTIDPLDGAALRGNTPRSYILFRINMQQRHNLFATISKSINNKWLTSNNNFTVTYSRMFDDVYGFIRTTPKPQIYFYTNNVFKIPNMFNIELLGVFTGRLRDGLNDDRSRYNITLSAEKSFYNNKLKTRLIAYDIFHGIIASGDYNVAATQIYFNRRWTTQYFRLAVTYNFGKLKKVNFSNKAAAEAENNRAR